VSLYLKSLKDQILFIAGLVSWFEELFSGDSDELFSGDSEKPFVGV
jgi:hypothetical protein